MILVVPLLLHGLLSWGINKNMKHFLLAIALICFGSTAKATSIQGENPTGAGGAAAPSSLNVADSAGGTLISVGTNQVLIGTNPAGAFSSPFGLVITSGTSRTPTITMRGDAANTGINMTAYGSNKNNSISFQSVGGTFASSAAATSGNPTMLLQSQAADPSAKLLNTVGIYVVPEPGGINSTSVPSQFQIRTSKYNSSAAQSGALVVTSTGTVGLNLTISSNLSASPAATLEVKNVASQLYILRVSSNSGAQLMTVDSVGRMVLGTNTSAASLLHMSSGTLTRDGAGWVVSTDSAAVTQLSGCGTSPIFTAGSGDVAGKITTHTTGAQTCVMTFKTAPPSGHAACHVQNETTANLSRAVTTATQVSFVGVTVDGDVLSYTCTGF